MLLCLLVKFDLLCMFMCVGAESDFQAMGVKNTLGGQSGKIFTLCMRVNFTIPIACYFKL